MKKAAFSVAVQKAFVEMTSQSPELREERGAGVLREHFLTHANPGAFLAPWRGIKKTNLPKPEWL